MEEIYKNFFSISNLIEYGYYDAPIRVVKNIYNNSIHYGLPDSIYEGVFSLTEFAEAIDRLISIFPTEKLDTEPITFTVPKKRFSRRVYKFPNLYSYSMICKFIVDNRSVFINAFKNDKNSTSRFFNIEGFEFEKTKEIEKDLLKFGKNVIEIDLANFYPTIYTHSIDWAERGKNHAKAFRKNNNPGQIAIELDNLVQNCQFGETHGLPTGTLMARIVAEYYMSFFDSRLRTAGFDSFTRYVDDFKFSYISESDREDFMREFIKICSELGLHLNESKTKIEEYPYTNGLNKSFIKSWDLELSSKKWDSTLRSSIHNIIDHCIVEENNGNKGSLKFFFSSLRYKLKNEKEQFSRVRDVFFNSSTRYGVTLFERLLDVSLTTPSLSNNFLRLSADLKEISDGFDLEINSLVQNYFTNNINYKKLINKYCSNNLHQELYQLLMYSYEFNVDLDIDEHLELIFTNESDDFSMILSILIYYRRLDDSRDWFPLFEVLDELLSSAHLEYAKISKYSRMREKFWLLRYFFYTFIKSGYIDEKELNKYSRSKGYVNCSEGGFKTELNYKYIFHLDKQDSVSRFYEMMLEDDVHVVNLSNL